MLSGFLSLTRPDEIGPYQGPHPEPDSVHLRCNIAKYAIV